jgi:hypothetical protein
MTADRMMQILKDEYGIGSKAELDTAIEQFRGVDIGLFVVNERSSGDEK